jgi:raffinose/stachyose/melibiose transport system substrate-binding protein
MTPSNRTFSRRSVLGLAVGVTGAGLLAACGQAAPPTAAPAKPAEALKPAEAAKPTEAPKPAEAPKPTAAPAAPAAAAAPATGGAKKLISFWQEGNSPVAERGWDEMAKAFAKAQPAIEVKRTFQADMNNTIKVVLSSDTGPDIFQRDIPPSYHQPLVDAGLVRALDDHYNTQPNLKRIFPWARKRGMINGKTWGVPHEVEFIPIYANQAVLEKAGIKEMPTKSYDDFLAACKTLKDQNIQPLGLAGRSRTQPGHLFSVLAMAALGKEGFEEILYGNGRWDGGGILEAATRLKQLMDLGYLPKDTMAQDGGPVNASFAAGRYAMWPTGTWSLAGFEDSKKNTPGFTYDSFIPGPIDAKLKAPQIAGGIGGGFSLSSKAKDADSAVLWLDFLMSPDAQKIWNEQFIQVAPVPFDPASLNLPDVPKKDMQRVAKGEELGYNISVVIPNNVVEVYWNGLGGILSGQLPPKDWTMQVQTEWDKAKTEGKVLKP